MSNTWAWIMTAAIVLSVVGPCLWFACWLVREVARERQDEK